ncbi:DUF6934 family protein [Mucilaginibacter sp. FT3.2]|uniref:DUF6934 family protein n=1 Tax=Mucilaginibacter sp. FT3.2 TaxID=2723090 RepID=UPI00161E7F04|nr:hypothetical protein [Mucilaginibacter sp. FT3.2]MBB6232302.1 hypothetical protein [Mucilaginibacter sp. FT3.2]
MNLKHYTYFTNDYEEYEFYSEGPKGRIKKVIMFSRLQDDPVILNLAFGDEDSNTGLVSDVITTDNKDRDIVLATVANTINDFCNHYGNHYIYATGSTFSRTRLYQMSISALWDEISIDFDIYGVIDSVAYEFQRNVNYEAFLVKRK